MHKSKSIVHTVIGEDRLKPVLYVACQSRRMHADNEMINFIIYWGGGVNIHILVFTDFINNRFQNELVMQNTGANSYMYLSK